MKENSKNIYKYKFIGALLLLTAVLLYTIPTFYNNHIGFKTGEELREILKDAPVHLIDAKVMPSTGPKSVFIATVKTENDRELLLEYITHHFGEEKVSEHLSISVYVKNDS